MLLSQHAFSKKQKNGGGAFISVQDKSGFKDIQVQYLSLFYLIVKALGKQLLQKLNI